MNTSNPRIDEWRFPNRATPPGSTDYYSVRFSPAPVRDSLAALIAWHAQMHGIAEQVSDPGVARLKLDWWRTELDRVLRADAGAPPRHPLSQLLAPTVIDHALPSDLFHGIIDRIDAQLRGIRADTPDALFAADHADKGALFALMQGCQARDDSSDAARHAGAWCACVERLRDSGQLLRRDRPITDAQTLSNMGLPQGDLLHPSNRPGLTQLLRTQAEQLRREQPQPPAANLLCPTLRVQLRLRAALLDELLRADLDLLGQRIELTPLRKFWLAWRSH